MTREMGKVLRETRGDVQEAVDTAYYMAGEGRRQFGVTVPSELPNKFAMAVRMPIGVCGMIAPWNFPWRSFLETPACAGAATLTAQSRRIAATFNRPYSAVSTASCTSPRVSLSTLPISR